MAPKESRAKWRATQVWKECDRDVIEKLACQTPGSASGRLKRKKLSLPVGSSVSALSSGAAEATDKPDGFCFMTDVRASMADVTCGDYTSSIGASEHGEDNESRGDEQQAIAVTGKAGKLSTSSGQVTGKSVNEMLERQDLLNSLELDDNDLLLENEEAQLPGSRVLKEESHLTVSTDSDLELDDVDLDDDDEEEEEESLVSALAREEGLHLANDIKFLSDSVEDGLERILCPASTAVTTRPSYLHSQAIKAYVMEQQVEPGLPDHLFPDLTTLKLKGGACQGVPLPLGERNLTRTQSEPNACMPSACLSVKGMKTAVTDDVSTVTATTATASKMVATSSVETQRDRRGNCLGDVSSSTCSIGPRDDGSFVLPTASGALATAETAMSAPAELLAAYSDRKDSAVSIAVQTLSTGDIMATQIFHDSMSTLV
ncbi:unnamed protein product [Protopolystoma xenopodis]|uniref:Uncharacterized protein n=1 Tax=Protopolystoma xenopodis TaxID=117903 RepID=A0A3S5ATK6_9PLAT|nr:unnamed protein product [Protopolystoma xenopodis]